MNRYDEKKQTVLYDLEQGIPVDDVAEAHGLTREEVLRIRAEKRSSVSKSWFGARAK